MTRLIGMWVIAGAVFKLVWGTPADLPRIVQELPPDLGLTFRVVIAAEMSIGLLALLKPRWAWLLVMALLILFDVTLITQIQEGAASCGCFGSKIPISPALMLGIDTTLLILLIVSRPWESMGRDAVNDLVLVLVLALTLPLPWVLDRELRGRGNADGPGGLAAFTVLEIEEWAGKLLTDTELAAHLDLSKLPDSGLWILWRDSCDVCAALFEYLQVAEFGDRPLVLIHLPEPNLPEDERKVHELPTQPFVHQAEMPADRAWLLETPGALVVQDGCVSWAKIGLEVDEHEQTREPRDPKSCE